MTQTQPFPDCATGCRAVEYLGSGECESVCPNKFDKDGNPLTKETIMTQTQHTPAPWRIEGQDIIGNEPNGFICTWSGRTANAHLIAAAPEMLEALSNLVQCISAGVTTDILLDVAQTTPKISCLQHARDILKKAKGKL